MGDSQNFISKLIQLFSTNKELGFTKLSNAEFKAILQEKKNNILIDVRTLKEYNSGHIKGSENYNLFDLNF